MSEYSKFEIAVEEWLTKVKLWQGVLYALIVCRRFYPLYLQFSVIEKWGDSMLLLKAERFLFEWLSGDELESESVQETIANIELNIPDSEAFDDCSDAMDAGIAHLYSLEAIQYKTVVSLKYVSRYCYDAMDRQVMDILLPKGGTITEEIEEQAESHDIIRNELIWQRKTMSDILALSEIPDNIDEFCSKYTDKPLIYI